MRTPLLLAGILLALLSTPALAADGGLYFGLHGGAAFLDESENEIDVEEDDQTFNMDFDDGWTGGASFGYDLRDIFPEIGTGRIELEAARRENDLEEVEFADSDMEGGGTASVDCLMLNTIGEYRETLPFLPYIGAGAGVARITLDQLTVGTAFLGGESALVDDDDTVFAYQFLGGVACQVAPRLYLDLGYRYFALLEPEFTDATGAKFESEYVSHNVTLGMRVDF